jgi:hypothetical protein
MVRTASELSPLPLIPDRSAAAIPIAVAPLRHGRPTVRFAAKETRAACDGQSQSPRPGSKRRKGCWKLPAVPFTLFKGSLADAMKH